MKDSHTDDRLRVVSSGREHDRRCCTVRQRMEALGWRFALDEDTCTLEVTKLVEGRAVTSSCYDVAYRRDLDTCAAAAEKAGDLVA